MPGQTQARAPRNHRRLTTLAPPSGSGPASPLGLTRPQSHLYPPPAHGLTPEAPVRPQPTDLRPATARSSAAAAPPALPQARTDRRPGSVRRASQNRWAPSRPERPLPPVWLLDPAEVPDRPGGGIYLPPAISRPPTDQTGTSPPSDSPGWPGPVSSTALPGRRAPAGLGPGRRGMATASSIRAGRKAGAPPALGPPRVASSPPPIGEVRRPPAPGVRLPLRRHA